MKDQAPPVLQIIFSLLEKIMITWARFGGYECSTKGDRRFSALVAKMPDGRTIEQWYQCDIKAYDIGGTNWSAGKGKKPIPEYKDDALWQMYLCLWRIWVLHNQELANELIELAKKNNNCLSDRFATTDINQAAALATILNEWS